MQMRETTTAKLALSFPRRTVSTTQPRELFEAVAIDGGFLVYVPAHIARQRRSDVRRISDVYGIEYMSSTTSMHKPVNIRMPVTKPGYFKNDTRDDFVTDIQRKHNQSASYVLNLRKKESLQEKGRRKRAQEGMSPLAAF